MKKYVFERGCLCVDGLKGAEIKAAEKKYGRLVLLVDYDRRIKVPVTYRGDLWPMTPQELAKFRYKYGGKE